MFAEKIDNMLGSAKDEATRGVGVSAAGFAVAAGLFAIAQSVFAMALTREGRLTQADIARLKGEGE